MDIKVEKGADKMLYSFILADACYEPAVEILNPSKLEGWNDPMGVPYWVVAYAYNNREKWRPHRRDHCTVYGEGGFWMGALEHTEFFIQDCDFPTDSRFVDGLKKYRWEKRVEEIERRKERDRAYAQVQVPEMRYYNVAPAPLGQAQQAPEGGWNMAPAVQFRWVGEPAQQPPVAPAPQQPLYLLEDAPPQPPVANRGLRIRERLVEAAARIMDQPVGEGVALNAVAHPEAPAGVIDPVVVRRRIREMNEVRERYVAEILNAPVQQALPEDQAE